MTNNQTLLKCPSCGNISDKNLVDIYHYIYIGAEDIYENETMDQEYLKQSWQHSYCKICKKRFNNPIENFVVKP